MIRAGQAAQVGPMAAVAGAIAQCVAQDLRSYARDVFVEMAAISMQIQSVPWMLPSLRGLLP